MKQAMKFRNPAPALGALLVLTAALALFACDSDVDITGPQPPELPPGTVIYLTGTLISEDGSCLEARLLYNGKHVGRNSCQSGPGRDCTEMRLAGYSDKGSGLHTVELQVLRQDPAAVIYKAELEVRDRPFGPLELSLGPTRETLREGEGVTFEFELP